MLIDLTMALAPGLPVFEGDPGYSLTPALSVDEAGYAVSKLAAGTHCGTHVDVPRHMFADGADAVSFPLDRFVGEAVAFAARVEDGYASLEDGAFDAIENGDIVLIHTGWDAMAGSPGYLRGFPSLCRHDIERLIKLGVKSVGTDLPSVEAAPSCENHRLLLGAGMGLVESLVNLRPLVTKRCFFSAAPLKLTGGDGSPVRAYALLR